MMKTLVSTLLALGLLAIPTAAFAAGEGTAVGVNPDALARMSGSDRILQVGADVSVGELIVTGGAGQVQIVFDDQTRLVVGPNSSLLIETYLMASSNTAQNLTINALGGTFRFISGNSPKSAYSIKTPTASIAVRGTIFDLISTSILTQVMLFDGALRVCSTGGGCEELVDRCDIGLASLRESDLLTLLDAQHRSTAQQFRYARFQSPLLNAFKVSGAIFCTEERPQTAPSFVSSPLSNDTQTNNIQVNPDPTPTPAPTPNPNPDPKR